ncbi:hypothetical protein [Nocardioides sp.]|uniref:hypothetical protein n=1 Tax=Nocardioides sp. TaxID=35761 RepID=UPI002ED282FC
MSEHSQDDPGGPEGTTGEHHADDTIESPDTGARYDEDGTVESTPEDERVLLEDDDEA